ncbi:hypothetical protein KAU55_00780 [Candidatus Bathyarchaeota archaeon]|nr:hypothetical protein [Candidatus Bathyarchaeota archaeon]
MPPPKSWMRCKVKPQPWLANVNRSINEDVEQRLRDERIHNMMTAETWYYKTEQGFNYRGMEYC